MEKQIIAKLVKLEKEIFDAVSEVAKQDKRSMNNEIQVLLLEALDARKRGNN